MNIARLWSRAASGASTEEECAKPVTSTTTTRKLVHAAKESAVGLELILCETLTLAAGAIHKIVHTKLPERFVLCMLYHKIYVSQSICRYKTYEFFERYQTVARFINCLQSN
jgi:hypothetical protein